MRGPKWIEEDRGFDTPCWIWQRYVAPSGYGQAFDSATKKLMKAHRWAYEQVAGPIPDGLHLDHLCHVRACVNPEHLEPVTQAENNRRAGEAKTHCAKGHPFTDENVYWRKTGRYCRICSLERSCRDGKRKRAEARALREAA